MLLGAIVTPANLLIGNHITVAFWIASWALPGLALDLSRLLNGGKPAWSLREVFTKRGLAAVVVFLAIAALLEMPLDSLGGYNSSVANAYVNTDWSQFADVVAVTVALIIARQFLVWTEPKAPAI